MNPAGVSMATRNDQLDTSIEVVTPENISFQYRVAGPFRRYLAYLIDLILRLFVIVMVYLGVMFVFGAVGLYGFGIFIALILWFVSSWFYGGLLETYWNGQTVGKRLLGLRVLSMDGQPINGLQAVMRSVLRFVDMMPFSASLLGLLAATSNRYFQRLGDLVCGTQVVIEDRGWLAGLTRIRDPAAIRLASDLPAAFDVPRTLGRALASYVDRREFFSPARRADIARHVGEPLRIKFNLPPDTSHDLILCALYYRTFITDQQWDAAQAAPPDASPPATLPFDPFASPELAVGTALRD